ncbi:MAG: RNase P subunit p30 family protein [Promethearchaeota archaeon]
MSYFESRLRIKIHDFQDIKDKIKLCAALGIKNVILESIENEDIIPSNLRKKIEELTKINIFYRLNIKEENLAGFKKKIKIIGNSTDILSVESINKDVQINSARDTRVDVISFSNQSSLKTLTPGIISLSKQNNSFIEVSLAPLLVGNRTIQSRNFRTLFRFLELIRNQHANYIISGNIINISDLRSPRGLISVCNTLLGIPFGEAKNAFKKNPLLLLRRVNNRNERNIIKAGVRIVNKEDS